MSLVNQALDGMISIEQLKTITAKTEGLIILQQRIYDAEMAIVRLQDENKQLDDDYWQLRALLRKPMSEIAKGNNDFKATYHAQMEVQASWMASQKAYKELAIELGSRVGLSFEDVVKKGFEKKIDVLEKKNNPEHGTNADDEFFDAYRKILIDKWKAESEKFSKDYASFINEGRLYSLCDEMPKDWRDAFNVWMPLAQSGVKEAQYNVARAFHHGEGVSQSHAEADIWYQKAFAQGEPRSAFNLYRLYENERFSGYSLDKSQMYFECALKVLEPRAIRIRDDRIKDEALKVEADKKKQKIVEENAILSKLKRFPVGGRKPVELIEASKDFSWAHLVNSLYDCSFRLSYENKVNNGSFFKPNYHADLVLTVSNPTDFSFDLFVSVFVGAPKDKIKLNPGKNQKFNLGGRVHGSEVKLLEIFLAEPKTMDGNLLGLSIEMQALKLC